MYVSCRLICIVTGVGKQSASQGSPVSGNHRTTQRASRHKDRKASDATHRNAQQTGRSPRSTCSTPAVEPRRADSICSPPLLRQASYQPAKTMWWGVVYRHVTPDAIRPSVRLPTWCVQYASSAMESCQLGASVPRNTGGRQAAFVWEARRAHDAGYRVLASAAQLLPREHLTTSG